MARYFLGDENRQYSLPWTAADPGTFQFPFLEIDRAHDWKEFTTALARFPGPGQNFVYADTAGNIGYHATGRNPIRRKNCPGDVPADGASGECEWDGMIPFEVLPGFYNPARGAVVTANQNPFPEDYKYPVNGHFATAAPRGSNSHAAGPPSRSGSPRRCSKYRRMSIPASPNFWRSRSWPRGTRAKPPILPYATPSISYAPGTARWKRAQPRRW